MNPLPISSHETERSLTELLNAFWKSYFTGSEVIIGTQPVTLPRADIIFNQSAPDQPGAAPQIHTVLSDLEEGEMRTSATQFLHRRKATLTIYVRAVSPQNGGSDAEFECRRVADAIRQLFERSSRVSLAKSGILNPRVRKGPVPLQTPGIHTRMLIATATLSYTVN